MYKQDLALNTLHGLICRKTQSTNFFPSVFFFFFHFSYFLIDFSYLSFLFFSFSFLSFSFSSFSSKYNFFCHPCLFVVTLWDTHFPHHSIKSIKHGGARSCHGYRRRKWTRRHEFKYWTRLIAFHIALIPLGKVWIQLFSFQLWVNSRAD